MTFDCLLATHASLHRSWDRNGLRQNCTTSRRYSHITAKAILVLGHGTTSKIFLLRCLLFGNQDVDLLATRQSEIGPIVLEKKRLLLVPNNQGAAEGLHLFILIL